MQDKQKEIAFFDSFEAEGYDVFTERGYSRILHEFKILVKPAPGEITADFGCGTGAFTDRLRKFGLDCIGIDISSGSIGYARKRYPKVKFKVGDIEKTYLKDNSVDIVVFSGVLHHFQDFSGTIKESHRVLRKGGRIFAYDPNKMNPIMWLYRDKKSPFNSAKGKTENERLLASEEICSVFKQSGFRNIEVHAVSGVGFKYVEGRIAKLILPAYNLIEALIDKTPLAKRYGSFLVSKGEK